MIALAAIRARRRSWPAVLIVCWLVVPVVLSIGESLAGQPILLYRNSLVSLPAVALLLGWGLMAPRVPRWIGWSGVGLLLALRALQLAPSYGVSPENWKGATRYVEARAQRGDCVAFFPSDGRMPFTYYAGTHSSLEPVLPAASWSATRPFVEEYTVPTAARLAAIEASCPRLWFIASHYGAAQRPGRVTLELRELPEAAPHVREPLRPPRERHLRMGQPGPGPAVLALGDWCSAS